MNQPMPLDASALRVGPPGPGTFEVMRTVLQFALRRTNMLRVIAAGVERYGDAICYRKGKERLYFFRHPDAVRHVLESNHANYRRSRYYALMKPVLGEGLLTSDGALWKRQRRTIQPLFSRQRASTVCPAVTGAVEGLIERWHGLKAPAGLDILNELVEPTLTIAGRSLFTSDVESLVPIMRWALPVALTEVERRTHEIFITPSWIPTHRNRRFQAAIAAIDGGIDAVLAARRNTPRHGDVFDALLDSRDAESGEAMSDRQIRDEVVTLLITGHETTALWLAFTLHLLAHHPEAARQVEEELDRVLAGRLPAFEDLTDLPYLYRVMQESLRIFPPAWGVDREAIAADEIAGHPVPPESMVFVSSYFTHRHPDFWEKPEEFHPDRFLLEAISRRPKYAFFPFGGGPRLCIGKEVVHVQVQLTLAMLLQRFRFLPVPGKTLKIWPAVTLRPQDGLWLRPERR